MRDMIRRLIEDAGLTFGEDVSDGNGGIARHGGRREAGGWVVAGNSARQVRQGIAELRKRDEKRFVGKALVDNGLRLSFHERSIPKNGVWSTASSTRGGTTTGRMSSRDHASARCWNPSRNGRKRPGYDRCFPAAWEIQGYP